MSRYYKLTDAQIALLFYFRTGIGDLAKPVIGAETGLGVPSVDESDIVTLDESESALIKHYRGEINGEAKYPSIAAWIPLDDSFRSVKNVQFRDPTAPKKQTPDHAGTDTSFEIRLYGGKDHDQHIYSATSWEQFKKLVDMYFTENGAKWGYRMTYESRGSSVEIDTSYLNYGDDSRTRAIYSDPWIFRR